MFSILVVMFGILGAFSVCAEPMEIHSKHWLYGYPLGTPVTNDLIIRDSYALSSNDTTKLADWVAYRLTPQEVMGQLDLNRIWRADPWLEAEETLEAGSSTDDYKDASKEPLAFDRGHLAPLGSFKGSRGASEVNYYSNIAPQAKNLNRGPWLKLEEAVRRYVKKGNTVWVLTGPLYESEMDPLPKADEDHKVPSGFWKVVMALEAGEWKVAAFIMPQTAERRAKLEGVIVTLGDVETRSGFDLRVGHLVDGNSAAAKTGWLLK